MYVLMEKCKRQVYRLLSVYTFLIEKMKEYLSGKEWEYIKEKCIDF